LIEKSQIGIELVRSIPGRSSIPPDENLSLLLMMLRSGGRGGGVLSSFAVLSRSFDEYIEADKKALKLDGQKRIPERGE